MSLPVLTQPETVLIDLDTNKIVLARSTYSEDYKDKEVVFVRHEHDPLFYIGTVRHTIIPIHQIRGIYP